MTIKTIFWDIGGVLERTEDRGPREAIAEKLGWSTGDLARLIFGHKDQYKIQLGLISPDEHFANIANALEIPVTEVPDLFAEFFGGDRLDRDLVAYIHQLKQSYQTAVISNYTIILRDRIQNLWQIGDVFDALIISSEVGIMKPAPGIFDLALERMDTKPDEAVFIDDFIENVEGARNIGMHAILFQTPDQTINDLNSLLDAATGKH